MVATVGKDEAKKAATGGQSSLKVNMPAYELISKIARLRNKSIANLFEDEDVENFFVLAYTEELRKETEKLKKKK